MKMQSNRSIPARTIVTASELKNFSVELLIKASGMSVEDATVVAENLVFANLRGTDTHGVSRLGVYVKFLEDKAANVNHQMQVVRDCGPTMLLDADNALGQIGAHKGMQLAIERAKTNGFSWVGVANSGHIGALAYWSMMALEHGLIGICFTSTSTIMAAHGSREKTLGNTPLAIAVPTHGPMPLVLDMAMSVAARGHLSMAKLENRSIPLDWAMDAEGVPTTDPAEGLKGSVLPIGGYKGSGLAMMIEVLTGLLTRSPFGAQKGSLVPPDTTKPIGLSHTFMAVKIDNFIPLSLFEQRVDSLMDEVKNSACSKGVDEIFVPNEKEYRCQQVRQVEGIPLSAELVADLEQLALKYEVPFFSNERIKE